MYTFTYQKTILYTLFYLFLKLSKAFSVSLRKNREDVKIPLPPHPD